eukprot:Gregarina_sp_Pseudo_9__2042@NODE_2414_length_1003_cov_11_995851_g2221_i0_p2_GENE_NODE_2414_length_1003_cov_11_995851_g2221_i0NODE_2414_length_1003_cov_11_995851_g2221_i0_p2_ORF_typecomplete_len149_score13_21Omp28/PF11551_8/0_24_NODE_2414_length_1003_cov_11_995851_g2221_i0113559
MRLESRLLEICVVKTMSKTYDVPLPDEWDWEKLKVDLMKHKRDTKEHKMGVHLQRFNRMEIVGAPSYLPRCALILKHHFRHNPHLSAEIASIPPRHDLLPSLTKAMNELMVKGRFYPDNDTPEPEQVVVDFFDVWCNVAALLHQSEAS